MTTEIELVWEYKNYICTIKLLNNTVTSHRCGYVKVPDGHLTNEIDNYDDVPLNVHGGLTYGSKGEWGFDCAHYDDTLEKWTFEAVKKEVENMVNQLEVLTWEDVVKAKLQHMPEWLNRRITIKGVTDAK